LLEVRIAILQVVFKSSAPARERLLQKPLEIPEIGHLGPCLLPEPSPEEGRRNPGSRPEGLRGELEGKVDIGPEREEDREDPVRP
jgi:hypothetical protein